MDNYLTIGLFNGNNLELVKTEIIDETPINNKTNSNTIQFHKCILLKYEISILGYILESTSNYTYLQLKNIIYNNQNSTFEIKNYLNCEKITINRNNIMNVKTYFYINYIFKINDHRFILTSRSIQNFEIYLIVFDIKETSDISLFIRYYKIPLKIYNSAIYNFLDCKNYNGFISLIYTTKVQTSPISILQFFSILSYINGTDSELIHLEEGSMLKPKDYINETNIENNVFGVELYGIKIIKLPNSNENGVYYISKEKNNIINENDILNIEDEIIFRYDYEELKIGNKIFTIEIAGIVREPLYSKAIKYAIYHENYGNILPEAFYQPETLIGKTCFYNYSISNNIIGKNNNSCEENCKLCYYNICLKCKNNYILENINNKKICLPENFELADIIKVDINSKNKDDILNKIRTKFINHDLDNIIKT